MFASGMSKRGGVCFVLFLLASASAASLDKAEDAIYSVSAPDGSLFRRDYSFNNVAGGWVKFHNATAPWHIARLMCRLEGARLASPINGIFYLMMRELTQRSSYKSIFSGVHGMSIGTDYFSVEGIHVFQMPVVWGEKADKVTKGQRCLSMTEDGVVSEVSCAKEMPFICYREKNVPLKLTSCGTIDPGYQRDNRTQGCYKLHTRKATWYQAHTTCSAEGAHLAIINSEIEAEVLSELGKGHDTSIYIGMFNWFRDDKFDTNQWKTTDDRTPEEAGFSRWQPGEPTNNGDEYCGAFGWTSNVVGFNDINCSRQVPFICEIPRPIPVHTE